jgi:outer membrane protein TolC
MKIFFILLCIEIIVLSKEVSFEVLKISASKNSHRLKLRGIDTSIEEARLGSVYSSLFPQLSLGYSGEYNHNFDQTSSGSISVGDTTINATVPYEHSVALRLNYELYHFGTTLKQIEVSKKEIAIKKLEQCSEEVKLYRELLDDYLRAQKSQSEKKFKSSIRTLRQELYTLKQRLYAAGKESRVSVGDEAIRLIDIERDIERAGMEFESSVSALAQKSYLELNPDDLQLLPLDASSETPMNHPFYLTPQARSYEEKIAQKQSEISMLNRSQLPVVSLYSSYYLYGSDSDSFQTGFNDIRPNSWNAGVSVRWSLFEGFKYNSESERLSLELKRISEESELAKREFDYETRIKQEKLERLALLTKNETNALGEVRSKLTMTQRLRAQGEADAVSEVSVRLEALERELTLESEKIQQAYEAESLKLQHREVTQCTPH